MLPARSLEAIKVKWRNAVYKDIVAWLLAEPTGGTSNTTIDVSKASCSSSRTVEAEPEKVLGQSSGSLEHFVEENSLLKKPPPLSWNTMLMI